MGWCGRREKEVLVEGRGVGGGRRRWWRRGGGVGGGMRREEAVWFYFVTEGGTKAAQWSWFWFCKVEPKVGTPEFLSAISPFEPGELGPN